MENIWIIVLFGFVAGAGFSLGKETISIILQLISSVIDECVCIEADDEKWN